MIPLVSEDDSDDEIITIPKKSSKPTSPQPTIRPPRIPEKKPCILLVANQLRNASSLLALLRALHLYDQVDHKSGGNQTLVPRKYHLGASSSPALNKLLILFTLYITA